MPPLVEAKVYAFLLETPEKRNELLCLSCRLAAGKSHATPSAEERLLVYGHLHYVLRLGGRAPVK